MSLLRYTSERNRGIRIGPLVQKRYLHGPSPVPKAIYDFIIFVRSEFVSLNYTADYMNIIQSPIEGLIVIEPRVFEDARGYFFESFNANSFPEEITHLPFVQDNESKSSYCTLRGLHYQLPPYAQSKLVRVISGEVLDVAVDIRVDSVTYGKWYSTILSGDNKRQMYIPRGFAHGYAVLSEEAIFAYKCDNFYSKAHEGGIRFDDPVLNIDWRIEKSEALLSDKDNLLPPFGAHIPYE